MTPVSRPPLGTNGVLPPSSSVAAIEGGGHALLDRLRNSDYHPADRVDLCREPRGMVQPPRGTPTRCQHENGAGARRGRTTRNILNSLAAREGGIRNPLNQ